MPGLCVGFPARSELHRSRTASQHRFNPLHELFFHDRCPQVSNQVPDSHPLRSGRAAVPERSEPPYERTHPSYHESQTFLNDGTWTICDYRYAVKNPTLVVASIRRVLSAIDVLLQKLPVYNRLEPILRDAQSNLQKSVLCTPENAKTCLAPFPHNVVECREIYDMVFMEKAHFKAAPLQVQKRRWAYNLNNVVSFMEANKLKSNALLNDDVLPMINMILDMK